jgi:murein DD-endopeptidase MepM/ murein hydrolase activator NlpD
MRRLDVNTEPYAGIPRSDLSRHDPDGNESSTKVMRLASLLLGSVLITAAACSRPVLYYPGDGPNPAREPSPAASTPSTPSTPSPLMTPVEVDPSTAGLSDADYLWTRRLIVPVAGADMSKVEDSFSAPRDGDRTHRALDILAPRGTPILAADDGTILRMSKSSLGGITMYTVDPGHRIVYYYAHMDHYNDAMSPGRTIVRGDTLGYVGTTGNAPENIPHLHFQIMRWASDGKYWNGEPIDPFDYLGGTRHGPNQHARSSPSS